MSEETSKTLEELEADAVALASKIKKMKADKLIAVKATARAIITKWSYDEVVDFITEQQGDSVPVVKQLSKSEVLADKASSDAIKADWEKEVGYYKSAKENDPDNAKMITAAAFAERHNVSKNTWNQLKGKDCWKLTVAK